jgi:DNA-directed RNA polymerase specialized sigma24 family protein
VRPEDIEELERRVARPDRQAFSALHRAYTPLLEHFVFTKVNSQGEAREITRHIFEQAWEHIERYRWQDFSFQVWLLRIAREHVPEPAEDDPMRGSIRRGL